jgi:CubicO group peptidase (beta-lactamase class C family)
MRSNKSLPGDISRLLVWIQVVLFFLVIHQVSVGQSVADKIDEYLQAYQDLDKFSGSVLVARNDTVLVSRGYGMADRELEIRNTASTKFRLGSVTKQFTSLAFMQLQERGELHVTDPLIKYIPDYPNGDKITIHHLLSHTAGVPNFTGFPDYLETMMNPSDPEETIGRFKDNPLDFEPGEKFQYTNSGYVLLGYILEMVSGMSYEDYLREHIFEPLGMHNSGYDRKGEQPANHAEGYTMQDGTKIRAPYVHMSIPHAAGGLYSTVEDLYKWDRALYTNKLVSYESIETMFSPVLNNYGYGWSISRLHEKKNITHGGGINGFVANIARIVDEDVCIIVLSNLDHASLPKITNDLGAIVFGKPYELPKERVAIQVSPAVLEKYVGAYRLAPNFILSVTLENGQLITQATGQQKVEIYPETESEFFLKIIDAQITFVTDDSGTVTHLILHQNGRDMPAEKFE